MLNGMLKGTDTLARVAAKLASISFGKGEAPPWMSEVVAVPVNEPGTIKLVGAMVVKVPRLI
jgi:hypothetical protein